MDWQTPTAALAGIASVAAIAFCYFLVLSSPTVQPDQPSSPVLTASETLDNDTNAGAEPHLDASPEEPDPAEGPASNFQGVVPLSSGSIASLATSLADDADKQEPLHNLPVPKAVHLPDHRHDDIITISRLSEIQSELHLSSDQEVKWKPLATALTQVGNTQRSRIDSGQSSNAYNDGLFSRLKPYSTVFLRSLREDQLKGAKALSLILGFKSLSAMVDAVRASTIMASTNKQTEPRLEVTPALPPISKLPTLADHRYDGLLTKGEIGRIKLSLSLSPEQEAFWPPVAAILRELGQQQMAQIDSGQKIDNDMSWDMAQRFYRAAQPLLQTLNDDQKAVVRKRARVMGLGAYASYL